MYDLVFEKVRLRGKNLRDAAVSYNLNVIDISRKKKLFKQSEASLMSYNIPTIFAE